MTTESGSVILSSLTHHRPQRTTMTNQQHTLSEHKRNEFRLALQRGGVPEVYAHMAAQEVVDVPPRSKLTRLSASQLLWSCFVWSNTEQGHDFWSGIAMEAK